MRKAVIAITVVLALSGCSNVGTTNISESNKPLQKSATNYEIITGWSTIPADNDDVYDLVVRIIKVENACYLQTSAVSRADYLIVKTDCLQP